MDDNEANDKVSQIFHLGDDIHTKMIKFKIVQSTSILQYECI